MLIIGSGSWGMTIGDLISSNDYAVEIYTRSQKRCEMMQETGIFRLSNGIDYQIKKEIQVINKLSNVHEFVFLALKTSDIKEFTQNNGQFFQENKNIVLCSKGINHEDLEFFSDMFIREFNSNFMVLSGPNFAAEVINKNKTITTVAGKDSKTLNSLSKILSNNYFEVQINNNPKAVEICGLFKNPIALMMGLISGISDSQNLKSKVFIKMLDEARQFLKSQNCDEKILDLSCGIGDIILSATPKSRNYQYGMALANNSEAKNRTVESITSVKSINKMASNLKLENINNLNMLLSQEITLKEFEDLL